MLYLITGANGAGKTLNTLKWVRERSVKEGRPVCHNGRFEPVEGGELSSWKRVDFKDWQKEPDGTIFLIDECHNDMPVRGASATVPDEIRMLAEHRRRGMDFYLVTQHPQNIDNFVRRLVGSPGWHRHLKRTFGADLVSCIEWAAVNPNCEKDGSGKTGTVSMVGFPKEVYGWYKSASLHTGKKKIPRAVWTALAAVILAPTMIYFAVSGVYKNVVKGKAEPVATVGASQAPGRAGSEGRVLTAAEYVDARVPRIPGFPHSAPVYDSVTQPVEAPYPAACVVMRGECKCYTQQATLLYMPEGLCRHIVERGFFVDFKQPSREAPRRVADQPRQEVRPVQPVQQQPPQQLQVVVAPLPQQDPGASYLQGLSARNAQVRSGLQ
ncbi:zonular occludens toxin domain-containing protein [Delftia tsuruhatensis]|jgi:zona occludens toxin|uniref:zonular occludens toxin domain-containing protein n=1 Tax=Delftia tsuruhatensis TaxID=180282 RepID=UPI002AD5AD58|nr:zonular occludens toxin domain-containing protein [Delftia tsuruhatensis]WQM84377.1 zonular occludens toxin domain-containing protein [Delftia tsuruhatensis]